VSLDALGGLVPETADDPRIRFDDLFCGGSVGGDVRGGGDDGRDGLDDGGRGLALLESRLAVERTHVALWLGLISGF